MNGKFENNFKVTVSMCAHRGTLSYVDTAAIFMNIASEDAEDRGVGISAMPVKEFFWLTLRT